MSPMCYLVVGCPVEHSYTWATDVCLCPPLPSCASSINACHAEGHGQKLLISRADDLHCRNTADLLWNVGLEVRLCLKASAVVLNGSILMVFTAQGHLKLDGQLVVPGIAEAQLVS